jgi:diguanylate cyclase (GGDEF)-like protein
MAGKSSRVSKKRAVRVRPQPREEAGRPRAKGANAAVAAPKRSIAMRLSAEVDSLKADLALARARVAELETRVDEDPLTGLRNRRGFVRALEQALAFVRRYAATAALVYIDLDRFKPINDRYGHAAGDWVLGRVARLVAGNVRASDVAARIGGDELALLLWNVNSAQAEEKARSIETMIEGEEFHFKGKRLAAALSAGATMLAADDTVESSLARADAAMYARKRERKEN